MLPFPLLLAPDALQRGWWWIGVSGCLLHFDLQEPGQGWGCREVKKSSLSFLLSPRNSVTSHSLDKPAALKTACKTPWIAPMPRFSSPFPQGVPITQLLDLKDKLVLRARFRRLPAECGAVFVRSREPKTAPTLLVWGAGMALSCNLCRLPAPAPLTALTMSSSCCPDLGQLHNNSHFCPGYIISLLWHRQDL